MDFREAKKEIEKEFQVHEVIKKLRVCFNVLQETHGENQMREYIDKYSLFEVKKRRNARRTSMVIDDMIEDVDADNKYLNYVTVATRKRRPGKFFKCKFLISFLFLMRFERIFAP